VKAAGYDANFLLNVGPMPNGKIQPEFDTRLREVGAWLARNGESIYGTRGGPVPPRDWGVTTSKGSRIYVHILDWPDPVLALPRVRLPFTVKSASFLGGGPPVTVTTTTEAILLRVGSRREPPDTVVVLETTAP